MRCFVAKVLLFARTVKHLSPAQIANRVRLRAQKAALVRTPWMIESRIRCDHRSALGWPEHFVPLDRLHPPPTGGAEANAAGEFEFVGERRRLGVTMDWLQDDAPQLWRYHLHYFEWIWSLVVHEDLAWAAKKFTALWISWRGGTRFGRWDAWSPYVVSVRAWSMCGAHRNLIAGNRHEGDYVAELRLHAQFIKANLELDVGGNHLIKNLKALIGLGVFLGDERLVNCALRRLEPQIAVQVLSDGGHFELSPSYHAQVLGDFIDLHSLLEASGRRAPPWLNDAVERMRGWLGNILLPDGDVPLFNDCTVVGPERLLALRPGPQRVEALTLLKDSGYAVFRPDRTTYVVADIGMPCPPGLPAHAHADCLSFELCVEGCRIIVDSGTSSYEDPAVRRYERSTKAHNTVVIDGRDQTEVWGSFRAGRRAVPRLDEYVSSRATAQLTASHDGYEFLGGKPRHRRTYRVAPARVEIDDEITGSGTHLLEAYFHAAIGVETLQQDRNVVRIGPLMLTFSSSRGEIAIKRAIDSTVATNFGSRVRTGSIVVSLVGELPLRCFTLIEAQSTTVLNRLRALEPLGAGE